MPMLRWFGFSRVTSLPPMTIVPAVGASKPAIMRSIVVLPQPDGPRKETNSPAPSQVEVLHDGGRGQRTFSTFWMARKDRPWVDSSVRAVGGFRREAGQELDQPTCSPR